MKTMYRVETRRYTDCEGKSSAWFMFGDDYYTTKEEAEAKAIERNANAEKNGWFIGDYRVVERTIDEATFTVTDITVVVYDYYIEVGKYESAKREIEIFTKKIEELEASKKNCKTEKGLARKEKEIAKYKKWLEEDEKILAERKG